MFNKIISILEKWDNILINPQLSEVKGLINRVSKELHYNPEEDPVKFILDSRETVYFFSGLDYSHQSAMSKISYELERPYMLGILKMDKHLILRKADWLYHSKDKKEIEEKFKKSNFYKRYGTLFNGVTLYV